MTTQPPSATPATPKWFAGLLAAGTAVWGLVEAEPVIVQGAVQIALLLGQAFGLHESAAQIAAINSTTAAILTLLLRRSVVPLASLKK